MAFKNIAMRRSLLMIKIWRVVCLVLHLGILKKPTMLPYWSTVTFLYYLRWFLINLKIERKLEASLHFIDNFEDPTGNKMFKLEKNFAMTCDWFYPVFHSDKFISVDESLLAWEGWLNFRQYIPSNTATSLLSHFGKRIQTTAVSCGCD